MRIPEGDKVFAGSVPKLYDAYPVPLIFEPYAADVVTPSESHAVGSDAKYPCNANDWRG